MKAFAPWSLLLLLLITLPAAAQDGSTIGGAFSLVDQHGRTVTDREFADRHTLLFFGYTFCPDVCPPSLQIMSEVMERLGSDAERVQPLFVTVDPERDTPERMKEYLENFDPRILGLSGTPSMIEAMAKAYRIKAYRRSLNPNDLSYLMDHTTSMILVGPGGVLLDRFGYGLRADVIAERIRKIGVRQGPRMNSASQ
ncbi:MAG TPA: SCO family protein [Azospirillum sp.]|nr:SCO family protein [Azospirillum sp.]